ncbi:C-5 cytosine-specific DNA methylase [Diplocarpon rosae]|nr:C-5 cytosine-specific DNA methylase [Diplocarpon rosae]
MAALIPGTVYVVGADGALRLDPNARLLLKDEGGVSQLKRSRALSTSSSCTIFSAPSPEGFDSDANLIVIEDPARRPNPPKKRIKTPVLVDLKQPRRPASAPMAGSNHRQGELKTDPYPGPEPRVVINLEEEFERQIEDEFYHAAPFQPAQKLRNVRAVCGPPRNPPIILPLLEIDTFQHKDMALRAGKTAELADGTFVKIIKVIKNIQTDEVTLRGWLLQRCTDLKGLLPFQLNEVCFVFQVELDDRRPVLEQSVVEIGVDALVKLRRLVSTNFPFPHLRFPKSDLPFVSDEENKRYVRTFERLVVRWKFTTFYENAWERTKNPIYPVHIQKRLLERLSENECTSGCFMNPSTLRQQWRGTGEEPTRDSLKALSQQISNPTLRIRTPPFKCHVCTREFHEAEALFSHFQGTHTAGPAQSLRRAPVIEILDEGEIQASRRRRESRAEEDIERIGKKLGSVLSIDGGSQARSFAQRKASASKPLISNAEGSIIVKKYTFADAFCGAGGTTSGAVAAGLQIVWGLDMDKNAMATWRRNFNAAHYKMWASEFVKTMDARCIVDILHLSPPCQVFSPIHTRVGKNDQQNFESLFACGPIIHNSRPRIITLEQTFGILHPKFEDAFNSLVQILTTYEYSVSYQIVEFASYGLAQTRRRLIIVAACPGETLPELPPYTHSENQFDGLKPLNTVKNVLSRIPRLAPNHDLAAAARRTMWRGPWDAATVIPTITCDGGTRGHPGGKRGFTERELASLQSFPHNHEFMGYAIKKQIGNAVPPIIAKVIFRAIVQHLEKIDELERVA